MVAFYEKIFGCILILPEKYLSCNWIDDATALSSVNIKEILTKLADYGNTWPTLEKFQYNKKADWKKAEINQRLTFNQ